MAAGLMSDLDLKPSFHQQVAYKASWHEIGDDAPQFAENAAGLTRWDSPPPSVV